MPPETPLQKTIWHSGILLPIYLWGMAVRQHSSFLKAISHLDQQLDTTETSLNRSQEESK